MAISSLRDKWPTKRLGALRIGASLALNSIRAAGSDFAIRWPMMSSNKAT